ncbi:hypothetical protein [Caenispirillum bisanense]|uniref:VPLPA-CTERM protein sorting domain-containing protein n=1 Tax=Caenispirillum bisanense TaxID=414052 RepID=A0A286GZ16_9PROT|nr:hypothetical protein [Caenispirillum bisanense]SOE00747.1 VPLPA-CTERM protein sorting domain-containing protein [Caenispirillum bisanense]
MKTLAIAAITGFLALGAAGTADAATYNLSLDEGAQGNYSAGFYAPVTGSFDNSYTFEMPEGAFKLSSSLTVAMASAANAIQDLTLALFQGTPGSGTMLAESDYENLVVGPVTAQFEALQYEGMLTAGESYYLQTTGTVPGNATLALGGSLSVAPVPLPAALPLFGAAVAGLAVAGRLRKKKNAGKTMAAAA